MIPDEVGWVERIDGFLQEVHCPVAIPSHGEYLSEMELVVTVVALHVLDMRQRPSRVTLKCGDGSIAMRRDGKILIKGLDLVSHAARTNRVKGGSVAIN